MSKWIIGAVCEVAMCAVWLQTPKQVAAQTTDAAAQHGAMVFMTNCAFCHGRDAGGGESGSDLTRSDLVKADKNGDNILAVVHSGRTDKGMPAFDLSDPDLHAILAFLNQRVHVAATENGQRRGVTAADLQTGNAAAGKAYFEGAGGCAKCHSATGDLKGVASRLNGLRLEQRMLYPGGNTYRPKATVTVAGGKTVSGALMYRDEFTIGVRDASGVYHSWPVDKVKVMVDDPIRAHVDLFPRYTDDDIHNLMAYIQTLR